MHYGSDSPNARCQPEPENRYSDALPGDWGTHNRYRNSLCRKRPPATVRPCSTPPSSSAIQSACRPRRIRPCCAPGMPVGSNRASCLPRATTAVVPVPRSSPSPAPPPGKPHPQTRACRTRRQSAESPASLCPLECPERRPPHSPRSRDSAPEPTPWPRRL